MKRKKESMKERRHERKKGRKEEGKTLLRRKNLLLLLQNLMICIYTLHQRKKERRKKENDMCAKRRLRSAWASAQSDQSFRCPHEEIGSSPTHWAHIEDYDQTGRMHRLIWVFAGRKDHFVGLVMRRLIYFRRTFAFKLKCSCWKEKVSMRGYIMWNIPYIS